ncbi:MULTISPECIES: ketopantoate reductase family protein [unclassified Granulicatella]|uniref:ketopantoate reductase family protein n=1 Tax=unclassified Granulicatella TaxID=2630493 RepID=UPI0010743223|nr:MULTISPECIES: 2-dehydropantoate 2-reductase [unclassified Granulicatella]MBF0780795.1 2-dehydropantoate 2-reductase [Granulicatella sp. 19428wC4_WM01]TFU93811.1 2-dehydropantoate 2-reductase [Granulicatella sp. WM01]
MKFAIVGCGAMGCRFAYQLNKIGHNPILVDIKNPHVDEIRENGLFVTYNGESDHINASLLYPEEINETADVVIMLTKSMQLDSVLSSIQDLLHEKTLVICLLNGLGHEHVMTKYMPYQNIVMGTTIWTAQIESLGKVLLHGNGNLTVQNVANTPEETEKLKQVVDILNEAKLNAQYSEDIRPLIWKKAAVNCCSNATTALLETNLNGFLTHPSGVEIARQVTHELVEVARSQNIHLDAQEISDFVIQASLKVGEHYTSMYQDLVRNHRLTEVDYLNGYIAKVAKEHGIDASYNALITQLIHIKETILDAK